MAKKKPDQFIPCVLMELPAADAVAAARTAVAVNPSNAPQPESVMAVFAAAIKAGQIKEEDVLTAPFLASLTTKYWGAEGVKLTVGFMEPTSQELRAKFLAFMNLWNARGANVTFVWTQTDPQVRITREQSGYWSFLGTDVLGISRGQPTMCLQGFTLNTPDAEWMRVVTHETGHTLSFPHEHLREDVVKRLDVQKTMAYFRATQGWDEATIRANVLTPLNPRSLTATPAADETSIMAYQLPASITKDGKPVVGGNKINDTDYDFVAKLYPGAVVPPQPPGLKNKLIIEFDGPVPPIKSYRIE